jgi:hypothetical protein
LVGAGRRRQLLSLRDQNCKLDYGRTGREAVFLFGPKQASSVAPHMSAFGDEAEAGRKVKPKVTL